MFTFKVNDFKDKAETIDIINKKIKIIMIKVTTHDFDKFK